VAIKESWNTANLAVMVNEWRLGYLNKDGVVGREGRRDKAKDRDSKEKIYREEASVEKRAVGQDTLENGGKKSWEECQWEKSCGQSGCGRRATARRAT